MFPSLQLQVSGLDPSAHYSLLVEFSLASPHKYKYKTSWEPVGDAERHLAHPAARLYSHPQGRALGSVWMGQSIHLNKIKLANAFVEGTILLNSMHKYIPRIHLIKQSSQLQSWDAPASTATSRAIFAFPNTEFIAVTAYANDKITQLKIENNPFAKGFRSDGNYGKRKLLKTESPESESKEFKKRRVSEEINVVDIDEEESNENKSTQHTAFSETSTSSHTTDDVFETTKPIELNATKPTCLITPPQQVATKQEPKENLHPASSDVRRRLEERVNQRTSKKVKLEANRTPNAAIKTLNNITNQIPNIELCHECKRLRTQFYRPWECDRVCQCRRNDSSNSNYHSINQNISSSFNHSEINPRTIKNEDSIIECDRTSRPIAVESPISTRTSFNMSRILDNNSTSNASPIRDVHPQYYTYSLTQMPTYTMYHQSSVSCASLSPNQCDNSTYFNGQLSHPVESSHAVHERFIPVVHQVEDDNEHPYDLRKSVGDRDHTEAPHCNWRTENDYERNVENFDNVERDRNAVPNERLEDQNEVECDNESQQVLRRSRERLISEDSMQEEVALDFSMREDEVQDFNFREEEVQPARSPSNYSMTSSSSGYESRNSSSSELQSPPPSPQYNKYDRYYSLPNISIVSTLF
ncbi:hypothetical protein WDU94_006185 [Cyamophila willieti]